MHAGPVAKEPLVDDLLVVGVDLVTGRTVHVGDAPKHVWKAKGYGGNGTLVCRDCLWGDGVPAGTRVPLLCRGKTYGKRRPHFAHPRGQGPVGGHRPETSWHADAKKTVAAWARQQPHVVDVNVERWTRDGRRRSDVAVSFVNGTRLAIEIQQQPLTDEAWLARHRDYARAGVLDVWLWHRRIGSPGIALDEPQCHWQLNEQLDHVGVPVAEPHNHRDADDIGVAQHYPPCPGDDIRIIWCTWSQIQLSSVGLRPSQVLDRLAVARHQALAAQQPSVHESPIAALPQDPPKPTSFPLLGAHTLHRIDGNPPWAPAAERLYRCERGCGILGPDATTDGTHQIEDGFS
jgi:hypothetical protein